MNIVVGSGLAGVAAAKALVARGQQVTIVDVGVALGAENKNLRDQLATCDKSRWPEETLKQYTMGMETKGVGVPKKLMYGSDFVYQDIHQSKPLEIIDSKVLRSFSQGGLSNVWGGCMMSYPEDELEQWPISGRDLAPFYRKVLEFVPSVAEHDDLAGRYPLFSEMSGKLNKNSQIKLFLQRLEQKRNILKSRGITFGSARVTVNNTNDACNYCGLCLYGCPYSLIYSAAHTLEEMIAEGSIKYINNFYVNHLEEKGGKVVVHGVRVQDGSQEAIKGERVFIGAGLVETTRILLESLRAYNVSLKVKHSDRFVLPYFLGRGAKGVTEEALHTLSQLFVKLGDHKQFPRDIHLQVYGYNDLFRKSIDGKLCFMAPLFKYPSTKLLEHLIVMFGYLHSDYSSYFEITLNNDDGKRIILEGHRNPMAGKMSRRVYKTLLLNGHLLGGVPIWTFMDPPGGGNHSGGSFPMRSEPGEFESDILGTPKGFEKVHIVDSSIFPSLPATTIGFPAMANAYRIADSVINN